MQVSMTNFTSGDLLDVHFSQTADSIAWWVSDPSSDNLDSAGYPRDTSWIPPYIPSPDSTIYPPDTTGLPPVVSPTDSAGYPRDTTWEPPYIPPPDSTIFPPDTSHYSPGMPPGDSTHLPADPNRVGPQSHDMTHAKNGNGYTCFSNKDHLKIEIKNRGNYQVSAAAYSRNADGSYSLIKTGWIRISAR
jgi:hypothetical protein